MQNRETSSYDGDFLSELNLPLVQASYANVLPSKLRHGNFNVMPLIPKNIENLPQSEQALLHQVIQHSSFTLAEYQKKNIDIKKLGVQYCMPSSDKELKRNKSSESFVYHKHDDLALEEQKLQSKIENVQSRRFAKEAAKFAQLKKTSRPESQGNEQYSQMI